MPSNHGDPMRPENSETDSASANWSFDPDALNAAALGLLAENDQSEDPESSGNETFARNLEAIALRSPLIAKRLQSVAPRQDLNFLDTADGVPSATLPTTSGVVALASKRRPLAEAKTIAESVDLETHGGIVVLGFALGYHAKALAERMGTNGVVIIYEPDLALLRAVLERIDHSDWIRELPVTFLNDEQSSGEMAAATRGLEAPLSIGIELVDHAPSRNRLGDRASTFSATFAEVTNAMRTQVVTTLVQSDVTLRNLMLNAEAYLRCPGIADLKNAASGHAAVVVSAGPSLERNLHLLADPAVRERVVVIAVQTVLRPMLSRGIRPDFVTALDYHEISTRFYEGLTEADLEGITLVAEPKVNPAVLDAFPGAIRLVRDEALEQLFGPTRTDDDHLTPGATVAHLAYYLARHLGCDPAILIGQDLGFTDGQYYASGAAIHDVWAPELNPFRSLEMFEWERIARGKTKLIQRTDHLNRPIYTDQQMATYLSQFEREFAADTEKGLAIIDATEGGVAKRGTIAQPLARALEEHAPSHLPPLNLPTAQRASKPVPKSLHTIIESILSDSRAIARNSRETQKLLNRIADLQDQPGETARINTLVRQIHAIRDEVTKREPAYSLVQRLNQTGTFQRFKSDRLLKLNPPTTEIERQKRQVQRDALNVGWIADMAGVLEELASDTLAALDGQPKRTRPRPIAEDASAPRSRIKPTVLALITADTPRSRDGLARTLDRLMQSGAQITPIILTDREAEAREALASTPHASTEIFTVEPDPVEAAWHRRTARARAWSSSCWRGGLGGASVYDQCLRLDAATTLVDHRNADAALILDGAWTDLDPELVAQLTERHAESPEDRPLVFTQAAPGLAPCLLSASGLQRLAEMRAKCSRFATIGGILSYIPSAAASDAIAGEGCVKVSAQQRDASPSAIIHPIQLTIEPTGAPTNTRGGLRRNWFPDFDPSEPISLDTVERLIAEHASPDRPIALTLACRGGSSVAGDPIRHPRFIDLMDHLRTDERIGFIHIRTDLSGEIDDQIMSTIATADVVSIDLLAQTEATYARISGNDGSLQSVLDNAQRLNQIIQSERTEGPLGVKAPPERWIVPRITRCDDTYTEIEGFYDHWLGILGHAVIDPLPRAIEDQRIAPLRLPALARQRAESALAFNAAGNRI
ncbi:MAG: 6-hydroxymethylpterin diphosphokinase MptE-like protein [Phycisphaerales bacterium JB065]